jgi:hypothetical protein
MEKTHWRNWLDTNPKESAVKQMMFVRDRITSILAKEFEDYQKLSERVGIIDSHQSRSIELPVLHLILNDGTEITLRNNFHDWKVSVKAMRDVRGNFMGLFDENGEHHKVYCEGFPSEMVYGSYATNKRRFTISLGGNEALFAFFWIFNHFYDHQV